MPELADMKMTPQERGEYASPPMMGEQLYPYGLQLDLSEESMEKLGLIALPAAGQEMMLHARVTVKRSSVVDTVQGKERSMCLQITKMALEPAPAEKSTPQVLYT